jgi:ATP-dependent Clp protease ATP-binding subunit ClpB
LFAEEGYDPQFGARPVKRVLQRMLLNELSKQLLSGTIDREKVVVIDAKGKDILFGNR